MHNKELYFQGQFSGKLSGNLHPYSDNRINVISTNKNPYMTKATATYIKPKIVKKYIQPKMELDKKQHLPQEVPQGLPQELEQELELQQIDMSDTIINTGDGDDIVMLVQQDNDNVILQQNNPQYEKYGKYEKCEYPYCGDLEHKRYFNLGVYGQLGCKGDIYVDSGCCGCEKLGNYYDCNRYKGYYKDCNRYRKGCYDCYNKYNCHDCYRYKGGCHDCNKYHHRYY